MLLLLYGKPLANHDIDNDTSVTQLILRLLPSCTSVIFSTVGNCSSVTR